MKVVELMAHESASSVAERGSKCFDVATDNVLTISCAGEAAVAQVDWEPSSVEALA